MRTAHRVVLSAGIATLVAITAPGISSLGPIDIGGYQLVSQVRVTRTISEFTYRAALTNHGEALLEPTAVATSRSAATVLVDDTVAFGSVAAGATTLSRDTFSFRHDRTVPFDWSNIQWNLKAGDNGNHLGLSNVQEEPGRAKSALMTPEGGALTVTGGNGVVYTLTVPEGALEGDTQIAMHPIANLKNLPAGESLSAGVHFTPEGLRFVTHATLMMQLPPSINPNDLIGIAYEGNAEQTRLDLHSVNGQTVTMSVRHFSGKVLGNRALAQLLDTFVINDKTDQYRAQMANAVNDITDIKALTAELRRILVEWYQSVVKPDLIAGAATPSSDQLTGITSYDAWLDGLHYAEIMTLTDPFPVQPELAESETLAVSILKRLYQFFNDDCQANPNGDLTSGDSSVNPLLSAGLAFQVRIYRDLWHIDGKVNQLDDETLLDNLCAKVVIEKIEAAPGFGPGATESVGVTAGFTIAEGPVRRNPRIRVQFQPGSGIVNYNPSSVNTDSTGIAATLAVWDSSFSQATVKVLANINSVRAAVRKISRFDQKTFSGPISPGSIHLFVNSRVTLCSTVRVSATVTGVAPGVTFSAPNITFTDFFTDGRETSAGFIPRISGPLTIRATSTADPSVTATIQTMIDPFVGSFGDGNPIVISGGPGTYTIDATGSGDRWVLAPQGNRFVGTSQHGTPLDLTVTDTHAIQRGTDSEGNLFEFQIPRICR